MATVERDGELMSICDGCGKPHRCGSHWWNMLLERTDEGKYEEHELEFCGPCGRALKRRMRLKWTREAFLVRS